MLKNASKRFLVSYYHFLYGEEPCFFRPRDITLSGRGKRVDLHLKIEMVCLFAETLVYRGYSSTLHFY